MAAIDVQFVHAGYCTHTEGVVMKGGRMSPRVFPSTVALITHARWGHALFDAGYSPRFYEATRQWPEKLYAKVTPVSSSPETTAAAGLRRLDIDPADVKTIIISHFHADHIGGLRDFPAAKFVFHDEAYSLLRRKRRLSQVLSGFLPALLPEDFGSRAAPFTADAFRPGASLLPEFANGIDVFGDGSAVIIDLPGHAPGHVGLLLQTDSGPKLLAGDSCWLTENYRELRMPHPITNLLTHDRHAYRGTLHRLHRLHTHRPDVDIVPCHCAERHPVPEDTASEGSTETSGRHSDLGPLQDQPTGV